MRIKNWTKFQHFKDRRPPWIKLYRDLLDDPDWHALDAGNAKALVMIWLIASESDGALPDPRKLAFRLRMTEKQVKQALNDLSHWLEQDDITAISDRYQSDTPERETETYREEAEGARASARPSRKIELPKDFGPDSSAGSSVGLSKAETEREFEKFKNHAAQNRRTCVDWQAAWRNWCIKAAEYSGKSPPKPEGVKMAMLTPQSPGWNPWKSYYRDTGQNTKAAQMDKFANEDRAMTFPTEFPPNPSAMH